MKQKLSLLYEDLTPMTSVLAAPELTVPFYLNNPTALACWQNWEQKRNTDSKQFTVTELR